MELSITNTQIFCALLDRYRPLHGLIKPNSIHPTGSAKRSTRGSMLSAHYAGYFFGKITIPRLNRSYHFFTLFQPPLPQVTAVRRSRMRVLSSMCGKGKRRVVFSSMPFSFMNGVDRTTRFERAWRIRTNTALGASGCAGLRPIVRVDRS